MTVSSTTAYVRSDDHVITHAKELLRLELVRLVAENDATAIGKVLALRMRFSSVRCHGCVCSGVARNLDRPCGLRRLDLLKPRTYPRKSTARRALRAHQFAKLCRPTVKVCTVANADDC